MFVELAYVVVIPGGFSHEIRSVLLALLQDKILQVALLKIIIYYKLLKTNVLYITYYELNAHLFHKKFQRAKQFLDSL